MRQLSAVTTLTTRSTDEAREKVLCSGEYSPTAQSDLATGGPTQHGSLLYERS